MIELDTIYEMEPLEIEICNDDMQHKYINIYNPDNDESIALDKVAARKLVEILNGFINE